MTKEDPANCPLCKIFAGEGPVSMVWQDERVAVFVPLAGVNAGHLLVVPKAHLPYMADLDDELAMQVMRVAKQMAAAIRNSGFKCEGINLFLADGEAAEQEVFHFHLHVYPRYRGDGFGFKYDPARHFLMIPREEMDAIAARIRSKLK